MGKPTKGPWKVKQGLGAPEIIGNGRLVARALYHGGSEDREVDANARLIAVAPELLEAADKALHYLSAVDDETLVQPISDKEWSVWRHETRQALWAALAAARSQEAPNAAD